MRIGLLLSERKQDILRKWLDLVVETYPPDTAKFLKSQKDRFANPVGHSISEGIEVILEELSGETDFERITPFLDNIIRIRAIQDFTPSQALCFVFLLKKVVRDELVEEVREGRLLEELLLLESKIDALANISFDIYMQCREKIYKLKASELRNRTSRMLKISNMSQEVEKKDAAGL